MEAVKNHWLTYTEKHPKIVQWFREGGLFILFSYVVTFVKYLMLIFLPALFAAYADIGWGWPSSRETCLASPLPLT